MSETCIIVRTILQQSVDHRVHGTFVAEKLGKKQTLVRVSKGSNIQTSSQFTAVIVWLFQCLTDRFMMMMDMTTKVLKWYSIFRQWNKFLCSNSMLLSFKFNPFEICWFFQLQKMRALVHKCENWNACETRYDRWADIEFFMRNEHQDTRSTWVRFGEEKKNQKQARVSNLRNVVRKSEHVAHIFFRFSSMNLNTCSVHRKHILIWSAHISVGISEMHSIVYRFNQCITRCDTCAEAPSARTNAVRIVLFASKEKNSILPWKKKKFFRPQSEIHSYYGDYSNAEIALKEMFLVNRKRELPGVETTHITRFFIHLLVQLLLLAADTLKPEPFSIVAHFVRFLLPFSCFVRHFLCVHTRSRLIFSIYSFDLFFSFVVYIRSYCDCAICKSIHLCNALKKNLFTLESKNSQQNKNSQTMVLFFWKGCDFPWFQCSNWNKNRTYVSYQLWTP